MKTYLWLEVGARIRRTTNSSDRLHKSLQVTLSSISSLSFFLLLFIIIFGCLIILLTIITSLFSRLQLSYGEIKILLKDIEELFIIRSVFYRALSKIELSVKLALARFSLSLSLLLMKSELHLLLFNLCLLLPQRISLFTCCRIIFFITFTNFLNLINLMEGCHSSDTTRADSSILRLVDIFL